LFERANGRRAAGGAQYGKHDASNPGVSIRNGECHCDREQRKPGG
jgi:hypothetical protein